MSLLGFYIEHHHCGLGQVGPSTPDLDAGTHRSTLSHMHPKMFGIRYTVMVMVCSYNHNLYKPYTTYICTHYGDLRGQNSMALKLAMALP